MVHAAWVVHALTVALAASDRGAVVHAAMHGGCIDGVVVLLQLVPSQVLQVLYRNTTASQQWSVILTTQLATQSQATLSELLDQAYARALFSSTADSDDQVSGTSAITEHAICIAN